MSWFGKEDNVERAQSKAIEENINREAKKVENIKYQEERKKVKLKQAEERAVRRANAPGLGQSLATGMKGLGSFANSMSRPSAPVRTTRTVRVKTKPRRIKTTRYVKSGKSYRRVTSYRTTKPRTITKRVSTQRQQPTQSPFSSMFSSPSSGTQSMNGVPDMMGLYGKKKGKGGFGMGGIIRY